MTISFIKNFILLGCCFYTYFALFDKIKLSVSNIVKYSVASCLLSIEMLLLKQYFPSLSYVIIFASFYVTLLAFTLSPPRETFFLAFLTYGLNLLLYEIFLLLVIVILFPFSLSITEKLINNITLFVCFAYPCIIFYFSKIPKFRNNTYSLKIMKHSNICSIIIAITLGVFSYVQTMASTLATQYVFIICLILLATFVLILWWRTQITKSYRERLRALEVESLRVSKQEQAEYISQLERENERMGRIIHKDNRIVNAMADSIGEYLQYSAYLSGNKLAEKGSSLQAQISEIRYDRQVLLDEKPATPTALPQTGYAGIDAMVTYMAKEASENKINFQFHYGEDFFTESGEDIKETDIVHLLSDSLENAIIATKFAGGKFIELSMLKIKGFPLISISDSGIPFELDTYMNLGLQKASTHLDTGGSGIGLMDLWELKEKYKATLYIDEHPEDANMTKRIVYIFDKKNRYMISTDRFKELQQKQTRADMFVINPNTEAVI